MRAEYEQTIAAADRTAARIAEGPDALATLVLEASAARKAGDHEHADRLDAAAERVRGAIVGVVMTGLREAVATQPHDLIGLLSDATDAVAADTTVPE